MPDKKISLLLSNRLIQQAASRYHGEVNISSIAREMKVGITRLWFYFSGNRKWAVDSWLQVMACLGAMEVDEDKVIIKVRMSDDERKWFTSLSEKEYAKKSPASALSEDSRKGSEGVEQSSGKNMITEAGEYSSETAR